MKNENLRKFKVKNKLIVDIMRRNQPFLKYCSGSFQFQNDLLLLLDVEWYWSGWIMQPLEQCALLLYPCSQCPVIR